VEIGTIRGTVVDVALRVTQVRDGEERLWYIRNGEILNVANHSRKN
jgi:small-conductance mechanosensitive channel